MKNKIVLIIIALIFLIKLDSTTAVTLTVCAGGCNSTTIQGAINNASANDIINILNGTYTENVTVNKSVTLNATPYIFLTGGFNVSVDNVTIRGFNITQGIVLAQSGLNGNYSVGIYISSSNNDIRNNYFFNITGKNGGDSQNTAGNGGVGGIGAGIYLSKSVNNNLTNNTIIDIHGGIGGTGGSGSGGNGGDGGIAVGIYISDSLTNYISLNNISKIYGGGGGTGGSGGHGGIGGIAIGIYLRNSTKNNITFNNLTQIIGGNGGTKGAGQLDGPNQIGFGVYISSDSYNNEISTTNIVDGDKLIYYYNKTGITIRDNVLTKNNSPTNLGKIVLINSSGFTIKNNTIANFSGEAGATGGNAGAIGAGVYLINSSDNNVSQNIIINIYGGSGGNGNYVGNGGTGGIGSGVYLTSSINNNVTNNTIIQIFGGNGGNGGYDVSGGIGGIGSGIYLSGSTNNIISFNNITKINGSIGGRSGGRGSGGTGGIGAGVYLSSSLNNNITNNNITEVSGGRGNNLGASGTSNGANQIGFGVYINLDSYNNGIDTTNTVDGDKVIYYYNKTGITIKDNILVKNNSPTNLGKIVLINSSGFTIRNNTIANFTGEAGATGGNAGAIGSGIYLTNSTGNNITSNTIIQIYGGTGGSGDYAGVGGTGGNSHGIYLELSANNNITNNTIKEITGGQGGQAGRQSSGGGTGGIGIGIYLSNSSNNNITYNNITKIYKGPAGASGWLASAGAEGTAAAIYLTAGSNNTIAYNWLYNNSNYSIYNNQNLNITAELNYFNASTSAAIGSLVYDYYEDSSLGIVDYSPWYLDTAFTISSDQSPSITINAPINNYNVSNETITFNITIDSNQSMANVSLYANFSGTYAINETNSSGYKNVSYIFSKTLADGSYVWSIEACDIDGNCSVTANRTINLDTTAPSMDILAPLAGSTIATADVITTASFSDATKVNCNARIDNGAWQGMDNDSKTSGTANYTFSSQANAEHTIDVNCTDTANITHSTNKSVTFTVNAVADSTKPNVTILAPSANAYLSSSNVIANVNFSDASNTNCEANVDNGTWQNMAGDGATSGLATYTFSSQANGPHTLYVNCTDTSSNNRTADASFTVDTVYPVVSLVSPANGTTQTSSSTVNFNFNVTDVGIGNCSLIINSAVSATAASITVNTTQTISKSLSNADYNWSINCTDNAGNENNSIVRQLTVSYSSGSGSSSSGGGGGGGDGGGGTTTVSPTEASRFWALLSPTVYANMYMDKPAVAMTTISFTVNKKILSVKLNVKKIEKAKEEIDNAYQYLELDTQDKIKDYDLDKAAIQFRVERSWMAQNDMDKEKVSLNRYTDKWDKLPTQRLKDVDIYSYYEATTPGFSQFAVAAEKREYVPFEEEIEENVTAPEENVTEEMIGKVEEEEKSKAWVGLLVAGVIVIVGIGGYLVYSKWKKKKR